MSLDNLTPAEFTKWFQLGQSVRRMMGKGAEKYSYNGVVLPDIYKVYTPELQEQYGAAVIGVMEDTGEYYLILYLDYGAYFPRVGADGSLVTMSAKGFFKAVDGQWIEASKPTLPKAIWSNVDVGYVDGTVTDDADGIYLTASEPVPVYQ